MVQGVRESEQVRAELLRVLNSRRKKQVPLEVYPANRHKAYCQMEASPADPSVLALCPKGDYCHDNAPLELEEEDLILTTEEGEQGRVPVLIIRPKTSETVTTTPRPAVVCLHSTGNSKETMRPFMEVSTNNHSLLSLPNTMSIQLVPHELILVSIHKLISSFCSLSSHAQS
jgi:hypothetical protein